VAQNIPHYRQPGVGVFRVATCHGVADEAAMATALQSALSSAGSRGTCNLPRGLGGRRSKGVGGGCGVVVVKALVGGGGGVGGGG